LPAPPPGQAYLGVDPANPMDEQSDLGCIAIDIAEDALLQPYIGRGGGPNALEIGCERGERCWLDGGRDRGGVMVGDLGCASCSSETIFIPDLASQTIANLFPAYVATSVAARTRFPRG